MPPVELTWYDGGLLPPRPEGLVKGYGGNGAFIIGEKSAIKHGSHGAGGCRIFPEEKMKAYKLPPKTLSRVPKGKDGHRGDWIRSCKDGKPACSNFNYAGPLTEMVLLGIIAMQVPEIELFWDSENMKFKKGKGDDEANALVKPTFRKGWVL